MLNTINELAKALDTNPRSIEKALDYWSRGRASNLPFAQLVKASWAALPEKPPVAEWLRRCLKLS